MLIGKTFLMIFPLIPKVFPFLVSGCNMELSIHELGCSNVMSKLIQYFDPGYTGFISKLKRACKIIVTV